MRLRLPQHVKDRMEERGITEEEIQSVLENPEADWPGKDPPGRRVYTGHAGGRKVGVVVVEETDPIVVVTTWVEQE